HRQRGEPGLAASVARGAGRHSLEPRNLFLIKDHVLAEERTPIQAKGIAKPVRNYAIIAPIKDLVAQGRAIHEEQDGLRLLVDLQKLDKEKAVKALESVLTRLKT